MIKCVCGSINFIQEGRSVACTDCMRELRRTHRQMYFKRQRRRVKSTRYYLRLGIARGTLNIYQAARMKGVRPATVLRNIHLLHIQREPKLMIKFDNRLLKWQPKRRLR